MHYKLGHGGAILQRQIWVNSLHISSCVLADRLAISRAWFVAIEISF